MPNAARIGLLLNPNFPAYPTQLNELQQAATIMGLQVDVLRANTDGEIEAAFESAPRKRIGALVLAASPFFDTRRDKLVALAAVRAAHKATGCSGVPAARHEPKPVLRRKLKKPHPMGVE
jgi:hypothetical protein